MDGQEVAVAVIPQQVAETKVKTEHRILSIEMLANLCLEWIAQDMDCFLALTTIKGGGKTTESLQLARHYYRLKFGGNLDSFNIEEHIAFSHEDFKHLTETLPDGSPIIVDEASNLMLSEDWASSESKETKKDVITMRTKHFLIIANMPDLWWFDRKYRENMITYWIHIYQRGYSALFAPSLIPGIEDRWFREYFKKIKRHWTYFTPRKQIENDILRHPTFQDFVTFTGLPTDIYSNYLITRRESLERRKLNIAEKGRAKVYMTTFKKTAAMVFDYGKGMKVVDIAKKNNMQPGDVYPYFKMAGITERFGHKGKEAPKNAV